MTQHKTTHSDTKEVMTKTNAILKLGAITASTQLVTLAIHKLAQRPVFLFGLGMVVGVYTHRYRKDIIASADYLVEQGKEFILGEDGDDQEN